MQGYYRAAEACLHMNRLDEAWQQNKNAQHAYNQSDEKLQMDILKQRQKIIAGNKTCFAPIILFLFMSAKTQNLSLTIGMMAQSAASDASNNYLCIY